MKKTFFSIVLMTALFAVVSCSKSFDPSEDGTSNAKVFTATIEEGTKTTLSENKVNWVKNDQISVMDNYGGCAIYKATTGGATTTDFEYVSGDVLYDYKKPFKAYYPSSLLVGQNLTPTLPATHTYVAADPFCIYPMYASSQNTNLSFKNICGVLAITIQGINVKTINVSSSNKAMSGSFTVDANNNAVLTNPNNASNSVTLDCGEGVSTTSEAKVFYIPIPAQTYNDIRILVNNESYMVTKKTDGITIARSTKYSFTYSGTNVPTPTTLSGEFSVSATKKVKFSKGNLQATINSKGEPTTVWKFATNQYTCLGSGGANTTIGDTAGDIDFFCWSTDAGKQSWGINTSISDGEYSGYFVDWGTNPALISALGTGWRTLSSAYENANGELYYLLNSRTGDKAPEITTTSGIKTDCRYAEVKVNGINGMLIFPDEFTWTDQMGNPPVLFNQASSAWNSVNYTTAQFEIIETAGGVFIPAAGCRKGSTIYDYEGNSLSGYYWSFQNTTTQRNLYFGKNSVNAYSSGYRIYGFFVRLVRDVE